MTGELFKMIAKSGFSTASASEQTDVVTSFRRGLADTGYVEGQNVAIEYRWGGGRLPIVFKRRVFLRMKKFFVLVVLASSFAAVAACAQDGKLDLATLTCQQLFEMKREQINIVLGWLQGYYLEENGPPVVDLDKLSADALRLSGYCRANPQEDVISAAEALFGK